jgi:serine protease AprX
MVQGRKWGVADRVVFGIRWDGGKRPRLISGMVVLVAALLAPASAGALPVDAGDQAALRSVFVVPAAGRTADAHRLVCRLGGRPGARIAVARGFVARVPRDRIAALRASSAVRAAATDAIMHVSGADDGADRAAASSAIVRRAAGAQALLDRGDDGAGVAIALVDTGVQALPGLDRGQVVVGPDYSDEARYKELRDRDAFGHGTHLAGTMVGDDPASGFTGVAPGAKVVSVKVAGSDGTTSLLQVLSGLEWIRKHKDDKDAPIRVVNLSLGVDAGNDSYVRDPLAFAAETLWRSGIVVVAAAGNNGKDTKQLDLPAADPFVVAVGAVETQGTAADDDDSVADFSSRSRRRAPDVVAPGTGIVSLRVPGSELDEEFPAARVGERFFRGSGTSQATAVVSSVAALLIADRPELAPDQVKALLRRGARAIAVPGAVGEDVAAAAGAGRVDAGRSAALDTPSAGSVLQPFAPAVLDVHRVGRGRREVGPGASQWAGRRWSGRRWSGRRWSGRRWSGDAWVPAPEDDKAPSDPKAPKG